MRFTIRDLLWLTVVVALVAIMGTAWWFDRWSLWARGYVEHLKAEQRDGELQDLIKGIETLPEEQLQEVREHLKKRRQDINSAGLNDADEKALPALHAPAPNPPKK